MHIAALVVCSVALAFCQIAFFLNTYLIFAVVCAAAHNVAPGNNSGLSLIYSRFLVDAAYTLATSANLIYHLISLIDASLLGPPNVLFAIAWPNYNIGTMRALLVLAITLDRVFAACLPIPYHKYRSTISTRAIFMLIASWVLFESFILFGICRYELNVPEQCTHFGCAVNTCYHDYWLNFEQLMYFSIGVTSAILCIRLFVWNHCAKRTAASKKLSRANRLALLDTFIIFAFDLLPAVLFSNFPSINFETVGPLNAVSKNFGFVIESVLVIAVLIGKQRIAPSSTDKLTQPASR